MKKIKWIFILFILIILLMYVTNITGISDSIILFKGEKLKIDTLWGINIKDSNIYEPETMQASINISNSTENIEKLEKKQIEISLLDKITLKKVDINIIPKTTVIPVGGAIGLKLYTNGVMVVGMSEIEDVNNKKTKPYEKSKIEEGDTIIAVNENSITCTSDLIENVNKSEGNNIELKYMRGNEIYTDTIKPVKTKSNEYKLGLWVRDAAAGVGTISFYEPETGNFAALGHGIIDIDTENLINISSGELITTNILSIEKGEKGNPGEIRGSIINQSEIGKISKNTRFGIYGKITNLSLLNISKENELEVLSREEIKEGPAKIICTLQNNIRKEYDIEIKKIYKSNNENNKSMVIQITDKELLNATGGIIQRNVTVLQ